ILGLVPSSGIVRVGDQMTAVGYGFGLSLGACQAFIDNVPITQFLSGSNDEKLIFIVPDVSATFPIPPIGRPGSLVVRGPKGRGQRDLTILPAKVAPPGGVGVRVSFVSAAPSTITVGQAARFKFNATSLVGSPVSLAPSVSFPGLTTAAAKP